MSTSMQHRRPDQSPRAQVEQRIRAAIADVEREHRAIRIRHAVAERRNW
jgi:hypothetical protein